MKLGFICSVVTGCLFLSVASAQFKLMTVFLSETEEAAIEDLDGRPQNPVSSLSVFLNETKFQRTAPGGAAGPGRWEEPENLFEEDTSLRLSPAIVSMLDKLRRQMPGEPYKKVKFIIGPKEMRTIGAVFWADGGWNLVMESVKGLENAAGRVSGEEGLWRLVPSGSAGFRKTSGQTGSWLFKPAVMAPKHALSTQ